MFPVLGQDISFHNLPGRVDAKMTMRRADKVVVQFSIMQKGLDCSVHLSAFENHTRAATFSNATNTYAPT